MVGAGVIGAGVGGGVALPAVGLALGTSLDTSVGVELGKALGTTLGTGLGGHPSKQLTGQVSFTPSLAHLLQVFCIPNQSHCFHLFTKLPDPKGCSSSTENLISDSIPVQSDKPQDAGQCVATLPEISPPKLQKVLLFLT